MKLAELKTISVDDLEIHVNTFDIRRDLHVFFNYIRSRLVKRSVRGNDLPKTDARRLAKLMSNPDAIGDVENVAGSLWLNFIDTLALKLNFTLYDTKGEYRGYTSSEPSFTDNYIDYDLKQYKKFTSLSLLQQERLLLETLIKDYGYSKNEFFQRHVLSSLNRFDSSGCATRVLPFLEFGKARQFLMNILGQCQSGVWYSTASLIQHLKKYHPFFLIPKTPRYKYPRDKEDGRYGNFREGKERWYCNDKISVKDKDAFERVEGRYVERFLEGIPFLMGYADVAYGDALNPGRYPSLGKLKAFKVHDHFLRLMKGKTIESKVAVLPNFEIHLEADFYPASLLNSLAPFTGIITDDRVIVLKLNKKKAIQHLADSPSFDLTAFLKKLTQNPLPSNIAVELLEWSGHSEMFTLYSGFGLLESRKKITMADKFSVKTISSDVSLVRNPDKLFAELEAALQAPLILNHTDRTLKNTPAGVKSLFTPPKKKKTAVAPKKTVTVKRKKFVTLYFSSLDVSEACRDALIKARCPVEADPVNRTITYSWANQKDVQKALKSAGTTFRLRIDDID